MCLITLCQWRKIPHERKAGNSVCNETKLTKCSWIVSEQIVQNNWCISLQGFWVHCSTGHKWELSVWLELLWDVSCIGEAVSLSHEKVKLRWRLRVDVNFDAIVLNSSCSHKCGSGVTYVVAEKVLLWSIPNNSAAQKSRFKEKPRLFLWGTAVQTWKVRSSFWMSSVKAQEFALQHFLYTALQLNSSIFLVNESRCSNRNGSSWIPAAAQASNWTLQVFLRTNAAAAKCPKWTERSCFFENEFCCCPLTSGSQTPDCLNPSDVTPSQED